MRDHLGSDRDIASTGLEWVRDYWDGRARASLPDLEKLEWSSRRSQRLRFEAFVADHDLDGKTILDIGCGLGDFLALLQEWEIDAEYTGFDISPEMVRQCKRRFPGYRFQAGNILEFSPARRYDYTTAFGIHSIRVPGVRQIMEQVTRHQFALTAIAAHVSLLSDRFEDFAPHIQAWPPEQLLTLALSITPFVALRHDVLETDVSLTLYRKPS